MQKITFIKNNPPSSHADGKPIRKPKPSTLHKAPLHNTNSKATKSKDTTVKNKAKKPTQLKHKDRSRPLTIEDYGKLRKILQSLSRWQRQPHELRHNSDELDEKPIPSYKELKKVLEDMTPEIVKKIANKIIAGDMNRTRLSDMKPLKAVHSLEVNLAAAKTTKDKDTGFKRVKVNNSNYKNWSQKGNKRTHKEDAILEEDAKTMNASKNGVATKENGTGNTPSSNGTKVSMKYAAHAVSKVQTVDSNKAPKLPSLIPIADKGRKHKSKGKTRAGHQSHKKGNISKQIDTPPSEIAMSDVQSNKRNFVHFVITENDDKKTKIPKIKIESPNNKTKFNETERNENKTVSQSKEKDVSSVSNRTIENATNHENQTNFQTVMPTVKSSVSATDIEEVFETFDTPSNNTSFEKDKKDTKKNVLEDSKRITKTVAHKRMPNKVLHVEAKWNGQINVKANWKDVDEAELLTKPKKSSSVKKNKVKPKKTTENNGEEEGNEEYNFDDSGSRNDLVWRNRRPLKEKSN